MGEPGGLPSMGSHRVGLKRLSSSKMYLGLSFGSDDKESACNAGDLCSIPGSGLSPGKGNGNPLEYSCLEIPWTEEPGRLQSMGSLESDTTERLPFHF